jgi:hypothetical protein
VPRAGRKVNIRPSTRSCGIVPREEVAISNNGHTPVEEEIPIPLRERLWFIFVLMCVFPPAGLVLLWRHEMFPPEVKWVVTIVILGAIVWALLLAGNR